MKKLVNGKQSNLKGGKRLFEALTKVSKSFISCKKQQNQGSDNESTVNSATIKHQQEMIRIVTIHPLEDPSRSLEHQLKDLFVKQSVEFQKFDIKRLDIAEINGHHC